MWIKQWMWKKRTMDKESIGGSKSFIRTLDVLSNYNDLKRYKNSDHLM